MKNMQLILEYLDVFGTKLLYFSILFSLNRKSFLK